MRFMQQNQTNRMKKESTKPIRWLDALHGSSEPTTQRKSLIIISRKQTKRKKRVIRRRIIMVTAAALLLTATVIMVVCIHGGHKEAEKPLQEPSAYPTEQQTETEAPELVTVYFVVTGDDGDPLYIDMQEMTNVWAAEAGLKKRYDLTDEERYELASVVTAEADGECFAGKMAIAQCILQAAEDDGISPIEVLAKYSYAIRRPKPSEESLIAVAAVFDFGWLATSEPIKYFYNPDLVESNFHESQIFVVTIGSHRFFKEKGGENHGIHIQQGYNENSRDD